MCEALRATPASGNVDSPAEDPFGALVEEPDLPAQRASELTYLRSMEVRAAWVQQPSWRVVCVVCEALSSLLVDVLGASPSCTRAPPWWRHEPHQPVTSWARSPWIRGFLTEAVRLLASTRVERVFVHRLAKVRELLVAWAVPEGTRSRLTPPVSFLLHMSGWLLALAQTVVQLRGGVRRSALARRRTAGLPSALIDALGTTDQPRAAAPMEHWFAEQVLCVLGLRSDVACTYLLSGERAAYVG